MKRHIMLLLAGILTAAAANGGNRFTLSDIYYSDSYGSWVVEVAIDNPDENINAFQCDIAIPPTFTFDVGTYAFTERAWELKMGKYVDTHTCAASTRANGTLRMLVYSAENAAIKGNSGTVVVQALKDATPFATTPHTSRFKANATNIVLTRSVDGEMLETPDYREAVVNDSTLQCYNCMDNNAFVIGNVTDGELEEINTCLATDDRLVTADLTRCTNDAVGTLDVKNGNTIIMARNENQVANEHNVFWLEDSEWVCNSFMLYDSGLSLSLPFSARARNFTYDRSYTSGIWNTVCLPVTLTEEQYTALTESGIDIRMMSEFDKERSEVAFRTVTGLTANTPYVIRPATDGMVFSGIKDVQIVPSVANSMTVNSLTMLGNYDYTTIGSTTETNRYGYEEGTGIFYKLGNNCILKPFRCFLELPTEQSIAVYRIAIATDKATDIRQTTLPCADDMNEGAVYSIDGRMVDSCRNADDMKRLHTGMYIVGKKKVLKN